MRHVGLALLLVSGCGGTSVPDVPAPTASARPAPPSTPSASAAPVVRSAATSGQMTDPNVDPAVTAALLDVLQCPSNGQDIERCPAGLAFFARSHPELDTDRADRTFMLMLAGTDPIRAAIAERWHLYHDARRQMMDPEIVRRLFDAVDRPDVPIAVAAAAFRLLALADVNDPSWMDRMTRAIKIPRLRAIMGRALLEGHEPVDGEVVVLEGMLMQGTDCALLYSIATKLGERLDHPLDPKGDWRNLACDTLSKRLDQEDAGQACVVAGAAAATCPGLGAKTLTIIDKVTRDPARLSIKIEPAFEQFPTTIGESLAGALIGVCVAKTTATERALVVASARRIAVRSDLGLPPRALAMRALNLCDAAAAKPTLKLLLNDPNVGVVSEARSLLGLPTDDDATGTRP